jgi:DNA-binding NarL/FixJ family response regulator
LEYVQAFLQAHPRYRLIQQLLREGGNTFGVAMAAMRLADLETRLGRPEVAIETCREVLADAEAAGLADSPAMASVHVALARLLLSAGEAQGALAEAARGRELASRGGQLAVVRAAEGLVEGASSRGPAGTRAATTSASLPEPLTARETDVLRLLVEGRSNRQIADELFLSVGTVKFHVHAVLGKLGATSRLEAAARARSLGLIT